MSNNNDIAFSVFKQLLDRINEQKQQIANLLAINANLSRKNDYLRSLLVRKRPEEESSDEERPSKWARKESSYVSSSSIGNSECSDSSEDMEVD